MKKISIIVFTVFLNTAFFSCHPELIAEEVSTQACCNEGEDIPPPPPPPPPGGDVTVGG